MELGFSCYVAAKGSAGGPANQPWVETVQRQHPDLLERVGAFWDTEGYFEWGELLVLAERASALFDEPEAFFSRFEAVATEAIEVPELASEGPGIREILQERIDRLAASPELRASYVELLREFWAALKPLWDGGVAKAAADMAAAYRLRLARSGDLREVLPPNHFALRPVHAAMVKDAIAGGEAVIVPLGLAGVGIAYFSFPHLLLIGVGPDAEKRQAEGRERTERASARFKVLADPTRLALLTSFCHFPATITDLASFFQLSQPTVSVHVKMLREAGLLDIQKVRGQTLYSSSREKLKAYLESTLAELGTQ